MATKHPEVTDAHREASARVLDATARNPLADRVALAIAYAEQRGAKSALAEAERGSEAGWIAVGERMPERSFYVLICITDNAGEPRTAEAQWFGNTWQAHQFGCVPQWRVTHWREKPPPPEPSR